ADIVDEALVRNRNLDRVEMLALEVFDEGELKHVLVGFDFDDIRRYCGESQLRRGADSPLTGYEFVHSASGPPHGDRLDNALLFYRRLKLVERLLVEIRPGL